MFSGIFNGVFQTIFKTWFNGITPSNPIPPGESALLLESGDYFLLENGDFILLEQ